MQARRLAWTIAGAEIALFAASIVLGYLSRHSVGVLKGPGFETIVAFTAPSLVYPVVGALIASRRPENTIGWLCLGIGAIWYVETVQITYAAYGVVSRPGSLPGAAYVGALSSWVPQVALVGTFFLLLFPDGHLPSRRWLPIAWLSAISVTALTLVQMFTTRTVVWYEGTHNPLLPPASALALLDRLFTVTYILVLASVAASVASLFVRYRRGDTDERQKLKWIAFAGCAFIVALVVTVAAWGQGSNASLPIRVLQDSVGVGGAFIPSAALFAVLRYRLYDIDRVISRTLSYAIVTVVLAAGYALVALVPTALMGANHVPSGLVAAAVITVAALFRPLRRRVQDAVDVRFDRARYDAAQTLEAFALRLRDQVDIDTLKIDLETLVHHTMNPAHVSLWLVDG